MQGGSTGEVCFQINFLTPTEYWIFGPAISFFSCFQVKSSCPLTCRDGVRITSSQLDEFTFVVAHLPLTGSKVTCDNGNVEAVEHNVVIGAIRITLWCGCTLQFRSKIIARSSSKICGLKFKAFKLEHLIPLQLSSLNDMVQLVGDTFQEVTFKNGENIIDYQWSPETELNLDDGITTNKINIWATILQLTQSIFIFFVFYKYRMGPFAFMAGIDRVNAQRRIRDDAVTDLHILMYVVIGLLVVFVLPGWLYFFFSKCKKILNRAVDNAAITRIENHV